MRKMYATIRYKWLTNQISGLALKTNIHKQIGLIYEGKWKIVEDRHDSKKRNKYKAFQDCIIYAINGIIQVRQWWKMKIFT